MALLIIEIFKLRTLIKIKIGIKNSILINQNSPYLVFGIFYAEKPMKTRAKGVKTMFLINKDVVLTTREAIQYLRISKPTYLKYIHLGRIRAVKAGNGWRVLQSELYRFLKVEGG
jgi:excisionase family DNA binding protein